MTTKETGAAFPSLGSTEEAWEASVRYEDMSLFCGLVGKAEEAERLWRIARHYRAEMVASLQKPRFECEARRTAASARMSMRTSRSLAG